MYINDFKHDKALTITHCSLMTANGSVSSENEKYSSTQCSRGPLKKKEMTTMTTTKKHDNQRNRYIYRDGKVVVIKKTKNM